MKYILYAEPIIERLISQILEFHLYLFVLIPLLGDGTLEHGRVQALQLHHATRQ